MNYEDRFDQGYTQPEPTVRIMRIRRERELHADVEREDERELAGIRFSLEGRVAS